LSARRALPAVVAVAVAAAALVVPGPWQRLANVDGDTRAPQYDVPLDDEALRRAGEIVSDDARYYVDVRSPDPLLRGNAKAATQLYLAPALPVLDERQAGWRVVVTGDRIELRQAP
jgi:hypothetical protein